MLSIHVHRIRFRLCMPLQVVRSSHLIYVSNKFETRLNPFESIRASMRLIFLMHSNVDALNFLFTCMPHLIHVLSCLFNVLGYMATCSPTLALFLRMLVSMAMCSPTSAGSSVY